MSSSTLILRSLLQFGLGALLTAPFSLSLAWQGRGVDWRWAFFVAMLVPAFTWVVQALASAWLMSPDDWPRYWNDLSVVCVIGSVALWPAAVANFLIAGLSGWWSVANVLASVVMMALLLRGLSKGQRPIGWPTSWCATITLNMVLFALASRSWW